MEGLHDLQLLYMNEQRNIMLIKRDLDGEKTGALVWSNPLLSHQAVEYAQGTSGISENVVSYQRDLQGYCVVTHFVTAAEPNTDINVKTVFSRVTTCIFVNTMKNYFYNLSLDQFQHRAELYPLLKSVYWYVIDAIQPERVTDFLHKIKANFKLMQYVGTKHDYLQEILPEIEAMILENLFRSKVE